MLKHLGVLASIKLLGFYNEVWVKGKLPTGWKESVIIKVNKELVMAVFFDVGKSI